MADALQLWTTMPLRALTLRGWGGGAIKLFTPQRRQHWAAERRRPTRLLILKTRKWCNAILQRKKDRNCHRHSNLQNQIGNGIMLSAVKDLSIADTLLDARLGWHCVHFDSTKMCHLKAEMGSTNLIVLLCYWKTLQQRKPVAKDEGKQRFDWYDRVVTKEAGQRRLQTDQKAYEYYMGGCGKRLHTPVKWAARTAGRSIVYKVARNERNCTTTSLRKSHLW